MVNRNVIIKTVSIMWLSSLLGAFFAFMTQVLIARILSPSELGVFSSYYYIVSLLVPMVGFGIGQFLIQEFGKFGWRASNSITPSLQVIIINF